MAEVAGRNADVLIVGTGSDPTALRNLGDLGRGAAERALQVWGLVYVEAVVSPADVAAARGRALPVAMSMSRFALSATFRGKNVPANLQEPIRARHRHYDFLHHAENDLRNPNRNLFDGEVEAREYLVDRFCIVGTAADCVRRLEAMIRSGRLDGVWITSGASDARITLDLIAAETSAATPGPAQ
jgi:alkanesulfonate monooxygenase SsuD/methylene tetrahydromethanopterin reductase-like flavin-dependent oxidoreductase (luciferase family)